MQREATSEGRSTDAPLPIGGATLWRDEGVYGTCWVMCWI